MDGSTALTGPAHRILDPCVIESLKWQRSFKPQRRRGRDWQDSCRTVRLCSPILPMVPEPVEGSVIKQDRCRTVRLRSPVLPIGSLKWQRSFKPHRRRVRDWQDRCRTVRLCSPVLRHRLVVLLSS